jgi:hypothetical protein
MKEGSQVTEDVESCVERAEGLAAVVSGENADVVLEAGDHVGEAVHDLRVEVGVEVGDVEDGEAVECGRELREGDGIGEDADLPGISVAEGVEAGELEGSLEDGVGGVPVFRVKEVESVAKDGFVIVFDAETLLRVDSSEP